MKVKRRKLTIVTALFTLPDRAIIPGDIGVGSEAPHSLPAIRVTAVVMAPKTSCKRNIQNIFKRSISCAPISTGGGYFPPSGDESRNNFRPHVAMFKTKLICKKMAQTLKVGKDFRII